jgi:predicted ATPase/DNA-binding winged helix-turn-helix (wHTH) protein
MKMPRQELPSVSDTISFGTFSLTVGERLLLDDGKRVPLGGRAFDILIALVERAGQVVSKKELMQLVWPDATVDEGSLRFHIASLRRALGTEGAGASYVKTLQGQGYCFVAPIFRPNGLQPLTTEEAVTQLPQRLPVRLSRMVGREETVQKLSAHLKIERFVTIVGPGGIGKTTVAVAVGHTLLQDFDGAVFFFDLGTLSDPLLVPSAIASTLGLLVQSNDPVPGLIAYLRDKRALLILDSCEHVIEPAASLAERIFREAPETHILATSREALRVDGEHVRPLMPLESPPDVPKLTAMQVLRFSAARLFVERVTAGGYPLELNDSDAPMVAEICRRLDGIALAIELAAGRVNAFGIEETAARLSNRLKLLWEGRRTAPPRHQTLSAMLDWSYDLLRDNERLVLRRLSVFVGVFALEAARAVAAGPDIDESQVVAALDGLVMKSLVAADTSQPATRYRLLDTTRAYALGKLLEREDADRVARRHAIYFLELLDRADTDQPSTSDGQAFANFGEHLGNVRAALEWSFLERGDVGVGVALAVSSSRLFLDLSLLSECSRWAERAIARLDETSQGTRLEMELQAALGLSSMFTRGNSEQAGIALKRGLVLAGELGDMHNELHLLGRLHIFHERIGDFRAALEYAKRDEALAKKIGDPIGFAEASAALGISCHLEGDGANARRHLEAALIELPASTRIDMFHLGFDYRNRARIALARALWLEGLSHQALMVSRETVEEAQAFNHPITLCIALIWAVSVFLWNGDLDCAEQSIDRFIDQADRYSLAPYQAVGRGVKGELMVRRGEPETGVAQLRAALETLHLLRYELLTTAFMTAIAEGLAMMGRFDEAIGAIDETIAVVERNGDLFTMPELLRVKGSIFVSPQRFAPLKAEACFLTSLDLAARQSALAWELRTATSLALLRAGQGRHDEAREVLAPVYARFTEGFDNSDLTAARDLLNNLN